MKLVEWMHMESIQHGSAKAPNDEEELIAVSLSELFHDFLTTGTLGPQPVIRVTEDYPSTPTFSISIDDEYSQDSSAENHIEDSGVIENGTIICPLQSYLLETAVVPVKKARRLSLGELFQETKVAEECSESRSDDGETNVEIAKKRNAENLMSNMLKKRPSHPSLGRTIDSLHRMLHIFNRKVHPESSTFSDQADITTEKHEIPKNEEIWPCAEDIKLYSQEAMSKECAWSFKNESQFTQISGEELWVKTDADYLVLEL